ncbi:glycosyltransferase [Butyrivibrio sp. TB]|uniref:glycosyltransferase n=1 Tax=Butyrivibrio sp. TB TaxID=1520809 RepID=UPI0008CC8659|nr:glycosyltransferase [Butyrivibrio sp. TB]SEP94840.1 hypothetical protein SAMN02910382_01507 [Butyrivibrio sp. TB]
MSNIDSVKYNKTLTAHMVVKNEDQWIWFSIMSVIDYVDKMLIFDTGSIDKTVEVIHTIIDKPEYRDKVYFEEVGAVSIEEFPKVRQRQLDMTDTDYILLVDGDEIWWRDGIKELREVLDNKEPSRVNVKFICPCVDMYHYRDFSRELYYDAYNDIHGSINGRVLSMSIQGLHCSGDYGVEGYSDFEGNIDAYDAAVLDHFYFHCTKLRRSSASWGDESISYRRKKIFDDWDHKFPKDYKYPEIFYVNRPDIVPDPFKTKDNLTKRISKRIIRLYRFCFKKKEYIKVKNRK